MRDRLCSCAPDSTCVALLRFGAIGNQIRIVTCAILVRFFFPGSDRPAVARQACTVCVRNLCEKSPFRLRREFARRCRQGCCSLLWRGNRSAAQSIARYSGVRHHRPGPFRCRLRKSRIPRFAVPQATRSACRRDPCWGAERRAARAHCLRVCRPR